jgi:hypothetical protein
MQNIQSAVGIFALLTLAFVVSEDRRLVSWRQAAAGLAVTFVLAVLMLKIPQLQAAFAVIGDAVNAIAVATRAGTAFVFGYLGGGPLPYELKTPGAELWGHRAFWLASRLRQVHGRRSREVGQGHQVREHQAGSETEVSPPIFHSFHSAGRSLLHCTVFFRPATRLAFRKGLGQASADGHRYGGLLQPVPIKPQAR